MTKNPETKIKRNRGSVAITLSQNRIDSMTEQDMLDLFAGLKTKTFKVNLNKVSWARFNNLKRQLGTLKRKGYIFGYYFDLEETAESEICGTITVEYTKVSI